MKLYNAYSMNPLSENKVVSRLGSFNTRAKARKAIQIEIKHSDVYVPECVIVEMGAYNYLSDGLYFSDKIIEAYANTKDIQDREFQMYVIEEIDLDIIFNPSI